MLLVGRNCYFRHSKVPVDKIRRQTLFYPCIEGNIWHTGVQIDIFWLKNTKSAFWTSTKAVKCLEMKDGRKKTSLPLFGRWWRLLAWKMRNKKGKEQKNSFPRQKTSSFSLSSHASTPYFYFPFLPQQNVSFSTTRVAFSWFCFFLEVTEAIS